MVEAVQRAQAGGVRVGYATGRMAAAVRSLHAQLAAVGPHVVHNGAQVRTDGEVLASWPLGAERARLLLELCRSEGWYCEFYVGDGYLVTDRRPEAAVHWHMLFQDPAGTADELAPDAEVVKASLLVFAYEDLAYVLSTLGAHGFAVGVASSPAAPDVAFVNVTSPEADKGRAIAHAAAHIGVGLDEVGAIGDGLNDLTMFAVVGTAIAMGQAPADVKAAAHLIVPEVAAHGVAHALDACVDWLQSSA